MTAGYGILSDPAWVGDAPIPGVEDSGITGGRGEWPRMLKLDEETEDRMKLWLTEEIDRARIERQPLIDDWIKWQTDYWAEPETEVKNFPFQKAANIVVPITAIAVEAVHARILNTVFGVEPVFSIRARSNSWIRAAPRIERWLQTKVENPDDLDFFNFAQESLMELIKLGTGIGKSGYERDIRKAVRQLGDGVEEDYFYERKNGATLDYVPLANFMMRLTETDPQSAPWCGEEHVFTWAVLKRMSLGGRIGPDELEEIKLWWNSSRNESPNTSQEYHEAIDDLAHTEPIWHERFHTQEIWASFDVDGDGIDEEIVIDYHWETETILSLRYNWYADLHRPYRIGNYIPVEGRVYGIGVGKQNEQFQPEITAIHRQRLDNATLANMRMMIVKKTSGFGPREPIWPGKMWFVDDPDRDIKDFQLSEVYPSSAANEEAVLRYSERRSGVNEVILGIQPQGTPGTATGDLARLAEGNKRFDAVLKNVRRWFGLLGRDILSNYQQFGDKRSHFVILEEEGQFVEDFFDFPQELVSQGAAIELTATDSITNQATEQQQWLQLFQVITGYMDRVLGLAQVFGPEVFGDMAKRALIASEEAMRRLLDTYKVVGADKLLLTNFGEEAESEQPPGGGVEGGGQGLPGGPQPQGLEGLLAGPGQPAANGGAGGARFANQGGPVGPQ